MSGIMRVESLLRDGLKDPVLIQGVVRCARRGEGLTPEGQERLKSVVLAAGIPGVKLVTSEVEDIGDSQLPALRGSNVQNDDFARESEVE